MDDRRVRTWWTMRERYRRIAWAASGVGVILALLPIAFFYERLGVEALDTPRAVAIVGFLLLIGFFLPRWAVWRVWRWQKLRHTHDWY